MCCANQGLYYFGVFGQSVKGGFDAFHLFADCSFLQHTDVIVKTVVGNVDKPVFFLYQLKQAFSAVQFGLDDRSPYRVFQVLASAVGERHQVFMVVVASSTQYGVQLVQIQFVHYPFQHVLGHLAVVYHS